MIIIDKSIEERQQDAIKQVKAVLYRHITQSCNFPEWKQVNYTLEYSELRAKEVAGSITNDESARLIELRQVIGWKNNLIAKLNQVEAAILAAESVEAIDTALDGLILAQPPFDL